MADIVKEMGKVVDERNHLATRVDELTREVEGLRARCLLFDTRESDARHRADTLQMERDHYMRQVVELMTASSNIASIALEAADKAAHGQYRASGDQPDPLPKED